MNFSTLFRIGENLNLDKKTLVNLRWIALTGQLTAINLVYFFLNFQFPIIISHIIIFLGFISNIFLQFKVRSNLLKDLYASFYLVYDLVQLSLLLYLTGGISNPFNTYYYSDNSFFNIFKYGYYNYSWITHDNFFVYVNNFSLSVARHT